MQFAPLGRVMEEMFFVDKIQRTGFSVWSQTSPRTSCAPTPTISVASTELAPVCPCPSVLGSPLSSRCGLASVGYVHSYQISLILMSTANEAFSVDLSAELRLLHDKSEVFYLSGGTNLHIVFLYCSIILCAPPQRV